LTESKVMITLTESNIFLHILEKKTILWLV